jgi:hypothetical protein
VKKETGIEVVEKIDLVTIMNGAMGQEIGVEVEEN